MLIHYKDYFTFLTLLHRGRYLRLSLTRALISVKLNLAQATLNANGASAMHSLLRGYLYFLYM
jgi:hypothetical protein